MIMKQMIPILLVLFLSVPLIGQITIDKQQKHRSLKKYETFKTIKNFGEDFKQAPFHLKADRAKILKFTKAADKHSLDSMIHHTWNITLSRWEKSAKEEFTYDSNEKVSTIIAYSWNSGTSSWDPNLKFTFSFNTSGNLTEQIISVWETATNQWTFVSKTTNVYDGSGNMTLQTSFYWDMLTTNWINNLKSELSYDSSQNLTSETGSVWNLATSMWDKQWKDVYSYNSGGNADEEINYLWNSISSVWEKFTRWTYSYNSGNILITEISYAWDVSQWVNNEKFDYTYVGANMTIDQGSLWNTVSSLWVNSYKDLYTYDGNGNQTTGVFYNWIIGPDEWSEYEKDEYTFDLAYSSGDLIVPFLYYFYSFNNMVLQYIGYDYTDPIWNKRDKIIFYYSGYNNTLRVNDLVLAKSINLYPNPVTDVLRVSSETIPIKTIAIYSIAGKKIKEIHSNFEAIHLDNLATGLYLVKIRSEHGVTSKKLIKR
jgi:hypothetical protein